MNPISKIIVSVVVVIFVPGCKDSETKTQTKMQHPTKNISVSINKPKSEVYEFASNPENFPKWLAFVTTVSNKSNDVWQAETDLGTIDIELTPKNEFGIVDHCVSLPDGTKIYNPLRIIENGKGSEVIFTLFRLPEKTQKEFDDDAKLVETDLQTLKRILEK